MKKTTIEKIESTLEMINFILSTFEDVEEGEDVEIDPQLLADREDLLAKLEALKEV